MATQSPGWWQHDSPSICSEAFLTEKRVELAINWTESYCMRFKWHWKVYYGALFALFFISGWLLLSICRAVMLVAKPAQSLYNFSGIDDILPSVPDVLYTVGKWLWDLIWPYLGIERKPKPFELYNKYRQNFQTQNQCPRKNSGESYLFGHSCYIFRIATTSPKYCVASTNRQIGGEITELYQLHSCLWSDRHQNPNKLANWMIGDGFREWVHNTSVPLIIWLGTYDTRISGGVYYWEIDTWPCCLTSSF